MPWETNTFPDADVNTPVPRGKSPAYILRIPNEILESVVAYLTPRETTNVMRTCQQMSRVAAYVRYTSLMMGPRRGFRLANTLSSGSRTSIGYCSIVRRIWFRGFYDHQTPHVAALLCDALPYLANIYSLRIDVSPPDATSFLASFKRVGMVRESIHAANCLLDIAAFGSSFSTLALPNLSRLKISGDASLVDLASYRLLEELEIDFVLTHKTFARFISSAQGTILGSNLKTLSLKLSQIMDSSLAFPMIASAFPNLERLSLEHSTIDFEAILESLACIPSQFNRLVDLVINCYYYNPLPLHVCDEDVTRNAIPVMDRFSRLMERVFESRQHLYSVGLGHIVWVVGDYGGVSMKPVVREGHGYWSKRFGTHTRSYLFPSTTPMIS